MKRDARPFSTHTLPSQMNSKMESKVSSKTKFKVRPHSVELLADISLTELQASGIHGIILDLDNTIVSEDDKWLSAEACDWIEQAKQTGFRLFILSNGKRRQRLEYWSRYLNIPAIGTARKPFPQSFYRALSHMQLKSKQAVVIGDSLHTDIIGAWLVGCRAIQVASLPHPPRIWEKLMGAIIHRPYPVHRQLLPYQSSQHAQTH